MIGNSPPSANGQAKGNGRGPGGQFAKGWKGGPGNPHAAEVGRHRARFFASIRDDDVDKALEAIRQVLEGGRDADKLAAARELLDRVIGKSVQSEVLERVERLECLLARQLAGHAVGAGGGNGH